MFGIRDVQQSTAATGNEPRRINVIR